MTLDAWLPIGHKLPDGVQVRMALYEGAGWQILVTQGDGRALVVTKDLAEKWITRELIGEETLFVFKFGSQSFYGLSSGPSQVLTPIADCKSPNTKGEALAFAQALKASRAIDSESPLQDALYIEKISRLLPTYSISSRTEDDVVLGYWLTGGANVSVKSFRRVRQMLSWMGPANLKEVIEAAGFEVTELVPSVPKKHKSQMTQDAVSATEEKLPLSEQSVGRFQKFQLPGRPDLEAFFNEHIVDIVQNRERYKALGISFPSAIVLHGPPGCGKTFAVERLVDFLGWPSFQIDASSVASPYIHETSRKVSEVFEKAMQNAPSVLVIDEMEAFLADRESGRGASHHRVEEVAEFLRRIPEAVKNEVLIVAMTNRIEMIDSAILRRGRFDHIIKVDFASEDEIRSLLEMLLSTLPLEDSVEAAPLAKQLAGRPLSDVTFVVREGARLSARAGNDTLSQEMLLAALNASPARHEASSPRIGFL